MYITDKNDINRFRQEQDRDYDIALREIKEGRKRAHWIWYIFPQLRELGQSGSSDYYGIQDLNEAKAYLADPVYAGRLREISQALLDQGKTDPNEIFGGLDAKKVCSSMTLFECADDTEQSIFGKVLDRLYGGYRDQMTLAMIHKISVSA